MGRQDAELPMCAEIVFEVCLGVAKPHVMLLEQHVHLETSVELKEAADLSLSQRTGPVALDGNRGLPRTQGTRS